ncbi:hypothetical protein OIU34_21705 [Pararhizobium sp. BT-229]|uniref:hypothetical protein n=1 Tax=Pararhizobium sp. BT-229 TaxID=2986923 RepID=UPI0021F719FF|nr:hypothetical protein [Pararhizobium sp. BT-229]MCV9964509.1 hypothetical protein [Pararhizobium sp. BT-229]
MKFSLTVDVPDSAEMTEAEARQLVYGLFVVDARGAVHEKLLEIANESGPTADAARESYRTSLALIDTVSISSVT